MGIILVYWLFIDKSEILVAIKNLDLPQILKYGILTCFLVLIINELLWFLFGKYEITIDLKKICTRKRFGLYNLKKNYKISEITNLNILHNVKSDPSIRLNMFWRLYAPQKEVLGFEYNGKERKIGMGTKNFDAREIKNKIEENKNYAQQWL
ncbi:hypothetical protein [Flagellimonas sediminis]|uniref:hypothetical protein n=1 Tax=Flagellimonas sediminis TaxID=2696468 RepID=UPI0013D5989E|nr:hypothetical protein [Allomuricauda sediminis]